LYPSHPGKINPQEKRNEVPWQYLSKKIEKARPHFAIRLMRMSVMCDVIYPLG